MKNDRRLAYTFDPGLRLAEEICERESSGEDLRDLTLPSPIKMKKSVWH